jgi:transcriptional regulator with XRE-family HTH domain
VDDSVQGMASGGYRDAALAAAIRELRTQRGQTQEDLAHDAGMTLAAFGRVERAQVDPAWSTVVRIAGGLRVSLVELAAAVDRHRQQSAPQPDVEPNPD